MPSHPPEDDTVYQIWVDVAFPTDASVLCRPGWLTNHPLKLPLTNNSALWPMPTVFVALCSFLSCLYFIVPGAPLILYKHLK